MKHILLFGAGRSSAWLVKYLLNVAGQGMWRLTVADATVDNARERIHGSPFAKAISLDITVPADRRKAIRTADLVISLLPPHLHGAVAEDCVRTGVHLITASYLTDDIRALNKDARKAGIIILMEMGVDPGIDHMSAMRILDRLRHAGHTITAFESFTGGLVAPDSDDNPWHYKFSWNPRNVVLAGQGGVKFIQEGRYKYIPYHKVFSRIEKLRIPGYGEFEGYANRDSLRYRETYGMHNIPTMFRGTLRRPPFCRAWNLLVQLGATEDHYTLEGSENMISRQFINSFLFYHPTDSVELKLAYHLGIGIESDEMEMLRWLGIFEDKPVGLKNATPAQILLKILEEKWRLGPADKDMIVMLHKINYRKGSRSNSKIRQMHSSMGIIGEKPPYTAMAKTVGLPLGIAAKLIIAGKIKARGVVPPVIPEIYEPVLGELVEYGVKFTEEVTPN